MNPKAITSLVLATSILLGGAPFIFLPLGRALGHEALAASRAPRAVLGLFLAYKWLQAVSDDLNSWAFFGWSWAGFFYIAYVLTREKKAE